MTSDYVETAASSPPLIFGSSLDASQADPPSPLHWRTFALPKSDPDAGTAIGWELRIDDLRGGYAQYGDFGRGFNQFDGDYRMTSVSAGLDQRFRRHLMLAQLMTTTTLGGIPNKVGFSTNLNGVLVIGHGTTANFSLFTESGNLPAAVTYTPASDITGLYTGVIGAATNAERLFVCMKSTAIDVHSVAGTSLGSMNAVTASAYGVLQTPINAATPGTPQLLIYANNSIYTLPVSSAIGAAPTQALQGIPNGGYAVGVEQVPKNWPLRAYWVMPLQSGTTPHITVVGQPSFGYAQVWSTNLEGTDRQKVPLPLTDVYFAALWRRHIVATDGARVVTWDGDQSRDLHILDNRVANSQTRRVVSALAVNDNNLFALVMTMVIGGTGSTLQLEQYIPEFDSWLPVSATWAPVTFQVSTDGGPYTYPVQTHFFYPQIPVSKASSRMYINMQDATWMHQFLPPSGHNPFYLYRKTGSGTTFPTQWETTGTWDSPYFSLPTLDGRLKRVDQVVFGGLIPEGNVKVTINPNEGGTAVQFSGADATRSQYTQRYTSTLFDLLQIRIQLNQGSDTRKTPNGLPITIRGRAFLTDADVQSLGLPGGI